ncbi:HAD family hydrolase [Streptomyces sp. CB03234]|uniref:HAD family hydrolase n=1 Tax=Streptomyces sp. (strain CB03234) TaxID=1703937 RepID=UPI0009403DC8|nr:HAD family phosphatase [Streptomyces sp. CB03234]
MYDDLTDVIGGTEYVLFGFDGPLCRLRGAATAWPTPYADPLIRTLHAVGTGLAVVSGTCPAAVERYLADRGLSGCFGPHVHGRVDQALTSLGAAPGVSLVIGATPADLTAARESGVPFLGYGRDDDRVDLLRRAGARRVVTSLEPVLTAVRAAAHRSARTYTEQRT